MLDAAEENEALDEARTIAYDLRGGGHLIKELGPLFRAYAPTLHRLADDLEELVAHLRGQRRYSVEQHHGVVFAEDEKDAIRKAWIADHRSTEYEAEAEPRPMVEED